jgi:hypothetical protein
MPQPYAARRPGLRLPQELGMLSGEQLLGLRINREHRVLPSM